MVADFIQFLSSIIFFRGWVIFLNLSSQLVNPEFFLSLFRLESRDRRVYLVDLPTVYFDICL